MTDLLGRKRIAALNLDLESAHENIERLWKDVEFWETTCIKLSDHVREGWKVETPLPKKRPRWTTAVAAFWILLVGVLVGGSAVPYINDAPVLEPEYGVCITDYIAVNEIEDRFQEIVNALYACGIYEVTP